MSLTYAQSPSDVATDASGNVLSNREIRIYTAKNGIRITALSDLLGTPLPALLTDSIGRYPFMIDEDTWDVVWGKDPDDNWWQIPATEVFTGIGQAIDDATEALAIATQTELDVAEVMTQTRGIPKTALGLGCIEGSMAAGVDNAALINAALQVGNVYLPPGVWWIADSIRVPSHRQLYGAGYQQTEIKMADGVAANLPNVTNYNNTNSSHTTVDAYIYLADFKSDANRSNRNGDPQVNANGCAVRFSTVKYALVDRVYGVNGHHSFDVSASVYMDDLLPIDDPNKMPPGPSQFVTFRNCVAGGSEDDAFTTHCSRFIRFEKCTAWNHEAQPRNGNSMGFELDDGSSDVTLTDCYSRGFNSGFQVKGHAQNIPARRVTMINCVAELCDVGFDLFWDTYATWPDLAATVEMIACSATNISDVNGHDGTLGFAYHPAVLLRNYTNVLIDGFEMYDSPTSQVSIRGGASKVRVRRLRSENCWTSPYEPAERGVVTVYAGAGPDIVIEGVDIRKHNSLVAAVTVASTEPCLVTDVRVDGVAPGLWVASTPYDYADSVELSTGEVLFCEDAGTSGAVEPVAPANVGDTVVDSGATWVRLSGAAVDMADCTDEIMVRRITQTGFQNTAHVAGGANAGDYAGQPPIVPGWWA